MFRCCALNEGLIERVREAHLANRGFSPTGDAVEIRATGWARLRLSRIHESARKPALNSRLVERPQPVNVEPNRVQGIGLVDSVLRCARCPSDRHFNSFQY